MFIVKEALYDEDFMQLYEIILGYLASSDDVNKLASVKGYIAKPVYGRDCKGSITFDKDFVNSDNCKQYSELVLIPLEEIKVE